MCMNNSNDLFKHLRLSDMSDFENIELIPIGSEGATAKNTGPGVDSSAEILSDVLTSAGWYM